MGGHNLETTNKGTGEMNTGLTLYKHSLVYYFYAIFSFSYLILQTCNKNEMEIKKPNIAWISCDFKTNTIREWN